MFSNMTTRKTMVIFTCRNKSEETDDLDEGIIEQEGLATMKKIEIQFTLLLLRNSGYDIW